MKQTCHNPPIHNFTGNKIKTWYFLTRPARKHAMFLRKYKEKQFFCGNFISMNCVGYSNMLFFYEWYINIYIYIAHDVHKNTQVEIYI